MVGVAETTVLEGHLGSAMSRGQRTGAAESNLPWQGGDGQVRNRREAPAADNRLAAGRADQIASLKPFATRNAIFFDALLALIRISSPVAGLRPLRAGRAMSPHFSLRIFDRG